LPVVRMVVILLRGAPGHRQDFITLSRTGFQAERESLSAARSAVATRRPASALPTSCVARHWQPPAGHPLRRSRSLTRSQAAPSEPAVPGRVREHGPADPEHVLDRPGELAPAATLGSSGEHGLMEARLIRPPTTIPPTIGMHRTVPPLRRRMAAEPGQEAEDGRRAPAPATRCAGRRR
jgi:hypothetical protein